MSEGYGPAAPQDAVTRAHGAPPDPVPARPADAAQGDGRVRLTEIRIHGVGGSPPEALLGDPAPTQVAGDRIAGFYRSTDAARRHREAYSWGGLTSRARSRALWTLLIPSMLANMAGWMGRLPEVDAEQEEQRAPTTRSFRVAARLSALGLTLGTSALVTMLTVDVLAYQCGGQPSCVRAGPLTGLVAVLAPVDHPGARLSTGGFLSGLVVLGFHLLARSTRRRYEGVEPPTAADERAVAGAGSLRTSAALPGGLRHVDFWAGVRWHEHLSDLHLTAALAVLAGTIAWPVRALHAGAGRGTSSGALLADLALVVAVAITALVVVWTCADDVPRRLSLRTGPRRGLQLLEARAVLAEPSGRARGVSLSHLLLWAAAGVAVVAGVAGWRAPRTAGEPAGAAVTVEPGALLGLQDVTRVVLVLGLVLVAVLVGEQVLAWLRRRRVHREAARAQAGAGAGGARPHVFPWCGPVVMNAVGMTLAVTVLLGAVLSVAEALGDVTYTRASDDPAPVSATIWVAPLVGATAAVLGAGLVVVLLLFVGVAGALALRRPGAVDAAQVRAEYVARPPLVPHEVVPGSRGAWTWSAFLEPGDGRPSDVAPEVAGDGAGPDGPAPNSWVRTVLRSRFLATHSQDLAAGLVIPVAVLGFLVVVGASVAAVAGAEATVRVLERVDDVPVLELGTLVAAFLPAALVIVLQLTFRQQQLRRGVGVAFDVGCFFPRAFHPFAPPSYTERAVPELLRRVWYLQDHGDAVVLLAHSQGSVLAAAALVRPCPRRRHVAGCVGLVTFGSPLGKLYRWAFPAVVSDQLLAGLARRGEEPDGTGTVRWVNVFYRTDYVGQDIGGAASAVLGADREVLLRDPADHEHVFGQPRPPVVSHVGYWDDERFWRRVDTLCADVDEADATARGDAAGAAAPVDRAEDVAGPAYVPPAGTPWQYRPKRSAP